jgi:hypothetical protein
MCQALVVEISTLLLDAIDRLGVAVKVDGRDWQLAPQPTKGTPHVAPDLVVGTTQRRQAPRSSSLVKPAQKIAGGRGIGNPRGTEQSAHGVALLQVRLILDARAADE